MSPHIHAKWRMKHPKNFAPRLYILMRIGMSSNKKIVYPLIIWGLGASFLFYKYILEVSPGVMSNELMRYFSIGGAQMGNLAATYFYAYLIMQVPMGFLLDR